MSFASIRGVTLKYGDKVVLQNCSLEVEEHAITCLIGLSGAGKSTILRLLNGLRQPDAGTVLAGRYKLLGQFLIGGAVLGYVFLAKEHVPSDWWEIRTRLSDGRRPSSSCGWDCRCALAGPWHARSA